MNDMRTLAKRTINIDYDFAYPPEKVWRALTEPALLGRWLMQNDFRPEVGRHFTFRTEPVVAAGFDGIIHCEVLAVEPGKRLSYTWRGGQLDTVLTWTLTAKAGGTLLHLEHAGFGPADEMAFAGISHGWENMKAGKFLDVLAEL
jgi:uncharacterized protein YndB with AHSA1/START domain